METTGDHCPASLTCRLESSLLNAARHCWREATFLTLDHRRLKTMQTFDSVVEYVTGTAIVAAGVIAIALVLLAVFG